jgi:hypothetical protein
MHNLIDPLFNGMGGSEMYRAQIFPELFPNEPQMMLENWPLEDLEQYVGGKYTPGYRWIREQTKVSV